MDIYSKKWTSIEGIGNEIDEGKFKEHLIKQNQNKTKKTGSKGIYRYDRFNSVIDDSADADNSCTILIYKILNDKQED